MSELAKISAGEFRDAGYLQEVNRRFFHPLGLAMFVDIETGEFGVFDDRDDPEGWYFGGDLADDLEAKAAAVGRLEDERRPAREAALGFWIQDPEGWYVGGPAGQPPS